jgi:hypothetical protein
MLDLRHMAASEHVRQTLADVATGAAVAGAGMTWVSTVDSVLKILVSLVAIAAGVAAFRYHNAKRKALEKGKDTD